MGYFCGKQIKIAEYESIGRNEIGPRNGSLRAVGQGDGLEKPLLALFYSARPGVLREQQFPFVGDIPADETTCGSVWRVCGRWGNYAEKQLQRGNHRPYPRHIGV